MYLFGLGWAGSGRVGSIGQALSGIHRRVIFTGGFAYSDGGGGFLHAYILEFPSPLANIAGCDGCKRGGGKEGWIEEEGAGGGGAAVNRCT